MAFANVAFILGALFTEIEHWDKAKEYNMRNKLVLSAVAHAKWLGIEAGFAIDPNEPDWPVAYIELPTGQVSWHLPKHTKIWDGHTTEEKYRRIHQYADGLKFTIRGEK